ncbi:MAG TPA: Ig-like domain-containing protein [Kiritimatiellia bacterium]|nr:Ig-like domain-containing protein [Kiritimatiellia bacterium]
MRKLACLVLVLIFAGIIVLYFQRQDNSAAVSIEEIEHAPFSPPSQRMRATNSVKNVSGASLTGQQANVGAGVYKPKSLQKGQGSETVVEIEHGLSRQLVNTPEMRRGVDRGLLGAITLRVVDSNGRPVQGAEIYGGCWNYDRNNPPATGLTDEKGEIHFERNCAGDFNFSITKDGFYKTRLRYWFFKNGYDCAKDGRWLPWNPTVEIVLKEKRNPVSMQRKDRLWLTFPKHQTVGFDVETGDLVEPFGTGKVADLSFWFDSWQYTEPYCYSNCFVVTAESGATIAAMRKDSFSDFKFAYAPPDSGWVSDLTLGMVRTKDKILSNVALGKEEYWVVAVRRGERKRFAVVSDFEFGGSDRGTNYCGVLLSYYLNPNPGDTNLEIKGPYP